MKDFPEPVRDEAAPAPVILPSGVRIGATQSVFVVAEIGNNHQGDFATAARMIEEAARIGVDAVKFQKRHTPSLLTQDGLNAPYTGANSFGPTYGEHREALELSLEDMARLKTISEDLGLTFFASVWDTVSLDQMRDLGVGLLKICSADVVNIPLLRKARGTGLPIIISTGMSTQAEVDAAVAELTLSRPNIILLHCNSTYPCPEEDICLPAMARLRERYGLNVGYSGHEKGLGPSLAAVALGACVVERHFTLDRSMRGTDHQVSLEPETFAAMTRMIREVEAAMRRPDKIVFPAEKSAAAKLRKSIVAARDVRAGSVLREADLSVKSPMNGISPLYWDKVLGMTLARDITLDQPLTWEDLVVPVPVEA